MLNKKALSLTLIVIVVALAIIMLVMIIWNKNQTTLKKELTITRDSTKENLEISPPSFSKFSKFSNGYSFEYPSFFDSIEILDEKEMIRFNYIDKEGIEVYLQVVSGLASEQEADKKALIERGWEEGKIMSSGKEYLFNDLNESNQEGVSNCSFIYSFDIPYDSGNKIAFVTYKVSQKDLDNCKIYDNPHYDYYIDIFDTIFSSSSHTL